jgi:beta-galactosidase
MSSPSRPRHQRPATLAHFLFGVPYYPEHWREEDRRDDAARMAAAGVNIVRMAEFAWDLIEPKPSIFEFSLFDETISTLGKQRIHSMLCTPTATPPRWLTLNHDDWMRVDASGRRMLHGSRQHCCTNNPGFREESRRITRVLAEHFAHNPHVVGWQTDNELYCHFSECYCDACVAAFHRWVQRAYGDIQTLNNAWGTQFWAQTYSDFDEIPLPYIPERPTYPNPGHLLDYYRFLSDSIIEFQAEQVAILRAANPKWWVTHNGMMGHIDYFEFARDLDFLGVDIYPGFSVLQPADGINSALAAEACRAASGSFIVPEQQAGAGGQRPYLHETPRPGQMRLWAWQAVAHGADGVLHFRWRSCRFGAEIYWNGVLDHDNVGRRRYAEFSREGEEFKRLGPTLIGTTELVTCGVLVEQDQDEAHACMSMGLPWPRELGARMYRELMRRHLPTGLVSAKDALDGLALVYLPSFELMDAELAGRLITFVKNGGVLVATARTATRSRNNQVISHTPPGLLAELFGVKVEEFGKLTTPLLTIASAAAALPAGGAYEVLTPTTAAVAATWSQPTDLGPHAAPGTAAVTINKVGKGSAVYIGTYLSDDNVRQLCGIVLSPMELKSLAQTDDWVEVTCRRSAARSLTFLLNHYPEAKRVSGLPRGTELVGQKPCTGELVLDPYGVAVVEVQGPAVPSA